jgi:hypothetical protein
MPPEMAAFFLASVRPPLHNSGPDTMKARSTAIRASVLGWSLALFFILDQPLSSQPTYVRVAQLGDVIQVTGSDGSIFTEYHYKDVPRPYFWPVLTADGAEMTRAWPMANPPGEEHDHVHHRGLWYAHGNVNGLDFWGEETNSCKIVHDGFITFQSGPFGMIKSKDKWVDHSNAVVCTDVRTMRFYEWPDHTRMIDFDITLKAPVDRPVVFGDTKEGTMATRVAESMRLMHGKTPGEGHIVMSTGVRDEKTWGKRADWCDYYGPVTNKSKVEILGVAMFDYPQNPRHPTTWHVRDYGLFAANPFGLHEFERTRVGAGKMTIAAGQSVTFRYRFYFHRGDEKEGHVAEQYQRYIAEKLDD